MTFFGDVQSSKDLDRSIILTVDNFRKGAVAPSDVVIGTTPEIPGINFSGVNEKVSFSDMMPSDWDKSKDVCLVLIWNLSAVQLDGDTLDVTLDYVANKIRLTGGGYSKVSTQKTASITVTTAEGLAVDDSYQMAIPLLRGDANNGFSPGDTTGGFGIEFFLTNVTGVSEATVTNACINYKALY